MSVNCAEVSPHLPRRDVNNKQNKMKMKNKPQYSWPGLLTPCQPILIPPCVAHLPEPQLKTMQKNLTWYGRSQSKPPFCHRNQTINQTSHQGYLGQSASPLSTCDEVFFFPPTRYKHTWLAKNCVAAAQAALTITHSTKARFSLASDIKPWLLNDMPWQQNLFLSRPQMPQITVVGIDFLIVQRFFFLT